MHSTRCDQIRKRFATFSPNRVYVTVNSPASLLPNQPHQCLYDPAHLVDKAGRDHLAFGFNLLESGFTHLSKRDNATVLDPDVTLIPGGSPAIDDFTARNFDV